MKNSFVYINTTDKPIKIIIEGFDGEKKVNTIIELKPNQMFSDSAARLTLNLGDNKKAQLLNVSTLAADGSRNSLTKPSALGNAKSILEKSVVLDIETSGRLGSNTITQIGIYDVTKKEALAIFPSVNSLINPAPGELSYKRIQSQINPHTGKSFKTQKYIDTYIEMRPNIDRAEAKRLVENALDGSNRYARRRLDLIEKRLIEQDFFQAEQMVSEENLKKYAGDRVIDPKTGKLYQSVKAKRLLYEAIESGAVDEDVLREHFKLGTGKDIFNRLFSGGLKIMNQRSMNQILQADLPSALKNKVTWIANAAFESSQFGAQIDAEAKRSFEEINKARVAAGKPEVSEKEFIQRFSYGGYKEEIDTLNVTRSPDDQLVTRNPMLGTTKGVSVSTGKPFFVTGARFQEARREAQKSGDYSRLYKVLLETTEAGDVRDILDLPRMQQSMLIASGDMTSSKVPTSVGVEVQARIYGFLEQLRKGKSLEEAQERLMQHELHSGIGDTALSETPILREALDQLEALEIERTKGEGLELLQSQMARGEGALFRAKMYGSLMDYLNNPLSTEAGVVESLHDVQMKARAGRYALDIATQGSYELREFTPGKNIVKQMKETDSGLIQIESHEVNKFNRTRKTNFYELLEDVKALPEYEMARKDVIIDEIKTKFAGTYDEATGEILDTEMEKFKSVATSMSESSGAQIKAIEEHFGERFFSSEKNKIVKQTLLTGSGRTTSTKTAQNMTNNVISNYSDFLEMNKPKVISKGKVNFGKLGGYAALAMGLATLGSSSYNEREKSKSLLIPTTKDYLKSKSKQYNTSEEEYKKAVMMKYQTFDGLQESGVGASLRKLFTDFGSPYQNPSYSLSVLDNHNLRRERERYNSLQFAESHFSENGSVGLQLKRFISSSFKDKLGTRIKIIESFAPPGQNINRSKYPNLTHNNLQEYDLSQGNASNYKISMEDADTLTVNSRQGNFSFRLAGIDAPETAHGDRPAQPFAEEAKALVQEMLKNAKDVRMVVEPGDMTYGRQVGMLYADGKNINLELIKRGFAAYLPYKGKGKKQLYNMKAFEEAQERAYQAKRGMWKNPFFQAYKMVNEGSGQSITFNTLANVKKVAKNSSLMSIYATMNQAQEMGFISNSMQMDIASISSEIKSKDKPFQPDSHKGSWMQLDLQTYGENNNSITSILDQQKYEIGRLMKNRNSKNINEKFKVGKVSNNNLDLTNEVLAKKAYKEENIKRNQNIQRSQQLAKLRIKKMEQMQQQALRNQFNSPIGHHRM